MNSDRVATVAIRALERYLVADEREAIIGDILERHHGGRSTAWLWWQTVAAIATGTAQRICAHPFILALAAFWIGLGVAALAGTVARASGLQVQAEILVAMAAGFAVGRIGQLPATVTLSGVVALLNVPAVYSPVMAFMDHFGGAWWVADRGLRALPASLVLAQASIWFGALCAIKPPTSARAVTGT